MTASRSNGLKPQGHGRPQAICADALRMAAGPKRAPGRLLVARSSGTPLTAMSTPFKSRLYLRRMKLRAPE
jgi:hypothetical protein